MSVSYKFTNNYNVPGLGWMEIIIFIVGSENKFKFLSNLAFLAISLLSFVIIIINRVIFQSMKKLINRLKKTKNSRKKSAEGMRKFIY